MPVLLDGKPGTGKTAFAKALAEVLKVPFYGINLGGTSAGFVLKGSASQWGSSREGQILSALATSTCANPVLLLDEIDKATGDKQYNVEPVLLELLEPATARRFTDEFAPLTFNAAHGIYIGTSNNTAKLSRPLLSRFEVISIPPPDQDQRLLIAKNMVEQQFSNLEFDEDALWVLAGRASNLRTLQRLIRKVVASYVTHRCRDSASASPPGRVTVFHAEQICHL